MQYAAQAVQAVQAEQHRKPSVLSSLEQPHVATQSQLSTCAHAASGRPRPAPPAALGRGASSSSSAAWPAREYGMPKRAGGHPADSLRRDDQVIRKDPASRGNKK